MKMQGQKVEPIVEPMSKEDLAKVLEFYNKKLKQAETIEPLAKKQ